MISGCRIYLHKDPSPTAISFLNKTDTGVTIQWSNEPTCYELVGFFIRLYPPNNASKDIEISKNVTTYTINDLSAGLTYRLEMSAVYGNDTYSVRSQEPLIVNFDEALFGG
jgi:hypothetical protein